MTEEELQQKAIPKTKVQKSKEKIFKPKRNDVIALAVIGSLLAVPYIFWWSNRDPYICSKREIKKVESFFDPLIYDWDSTNALANETPRITLSIPISELQDIQQNVSNASIPKCAEPLRESFINMASKEIDSYLLFMSGENEDIQNIAINEAETAKRLFASDYTDFKQGLSLDSLERIKRWNKETERIIKDLKKK